MINFQAFPKISRLFRDMVITEKIDGTNAAIGIDDSLLADWEPGTVLGEGVTLTRGDNEKVYFVYAQSRNRLITPEKGNYGFAAWVRDNAETLFDDLGVGLHFGEWWGNGIQRGYGLPKGEKRFSLFNVKRWEDTEFCTPNVSVVPVLYRGPFETFVVTSTMEMLRRVGSVVSPGFMNPEGVVVYHTAGNVMFKATLVGDEKPKSLEE